MLNNCKDKRRKGLQFSQQKGKIRKKSNLDIFIKQHEGISRADVGQDGQCGGVVASIKGKRTSLSNSITAQFRMDLWQRCLLS
jgi:hypothetical protein